MSRRRTRVIQREALRIRPTKKTEHIPDDDRYVLKENAGTPLERGGIYSEMGADFTYEELNSFPTKDHEFTHYEQHGTKKSISLLEVLGVIMMFIGLFIILVSPFWFAITTLGILLVLKKYSLNKTMNIALFITILGFVFALYSMFSS